MEDMETIKELKKLLRTPFTMDDYESVFEKIAKSVIRNYYIQCGEKKYYFAEIEFYYYDKKSFNNEWNRKTYQRVANAGDLFFHYSGCDICFESVIDEEQNDVRFGGILIRSLYDTSKEKYLTGPTVCANEMLNCCSQSKSEIKTLPTILYKKEIHKCEIDKPILRAGLEDEPLCYYDKNIKCNNTFDKAKWDYDEKHNGMSPKLVDFKRSYDRFKSKK